VHPVVALIDVFGMTRPIPSYGVMLALSIALAGTIAARAAHRAGIDVGATIALLGFVAMGAFVGAWSTFVGVEWLRTGQLTDAVTSLGLVFYGAPFGGGLAFAIFGRALGLPRARLADVALPAIPAAHAVGRIGCFLGGCCFGRPWDGPLAVTYVHPLAPAAHPSVPRHPVPLYEAGLLLALAFAFSLWPMRGVGSGRRLAAYFASYGVLRAVIECFRGDVVRGVYVGGVSTSQVVSVVVTLLAVGFLVARRPGPGRHALEGARRDA
jgi:phosphatidylglycerol:prolipoprotein diacylglycerol transferase